MKDPLYKALTRPPLIFGLPILVVVLIAWITVLLGFFVSWWVILAGVFVFVLAMYVSSHDDMYFFMLIPRIKVMSGIFSMILSKKFFGKKLDFITSNKNRNIQSEWGNKVVNLKHFADIEKYIPYSTHATKNIIITKDYDCVATWQVYGVPFENTDEIYLEQMKQELDNLIRTFADDNVFIQVNLVRKNIKIENMGDYGGCPKIVQDIIQLYSEKTNSLQNIKVNTYYVSLILKSKSVDFINTKFSFIDEIYKFINPKKYKQKRIDNEIELNNIINSYVKTMETLVSRFGSGLKRFGGKLLSIYKKDNGIYSEQINFYSYLLTGKDREIRLQKTKLSNLLSADDLIFGERTLQINSDDNTKRFAKVIEIKVYENYTKQDVFNFFLDLPFDYVVTQSLGLLNTQKGADLVSRKKRQFSSANEDGSKQIEDLKIFVDSIRSNDTAIGEYSFSVIIYADSLHEIQNNITKIQSELNRTGFLCKEGSLSLKATFLSQLPGNIKFRTRVCYLQSINFASLMNLHNYSMGKADNNVWGKAITVFQTRGGLPYYFNYHEANIGSSDFGKENSGNFFVSGGTGSGKTLTTSFNIINALKYNNPKTFPSHVAMEHRKLRVILFDKDRALQMMCLAVGGKYIVMKRSTPTNLNPFAIENNKSNISFLNSFIEHLCLLDQNKVSVMQKAEIDKAVKQVMALEDRSFGISKLLNFLPIKSTEEEKEVSLYERLKRWSKQGNLGWLFDNEIDDLSFEDNLITGIDGTEFLDEKEILSPFTMYCFYKLEKLRAEPSRKIIFFDEVQKYANASPLIDEKIEDCYRTGRKQNMIIGCATQDAISLNQTKTGGVVIKQAETKVHSPEKSYDKKYCIDILGMTEKEFDVFKSLNKNKREIFIRKTSSDNDIVDSVVVSVNLSCLKGYLKILSIGNTDRAYADTLLETYTDPKDWIIKFNETMENINQQERENETIN